MIPVALPPDFHAVDAHSEVRFVSEEVRRSQLEVAHLMANPGTWLMLRKAGHTAKSHTDFFADLRETIASDSDGDPYDENGDLALSLRSYQEDVVALLNTTNSLDTSFDKTELLSALQALIQEVLGVRSLLAEHDAAVFFQNASKKDFISEEGLLAELEMIDASSQSN